MDMQYCAQSNFGPFNYPNGHPMAMQYQDEQYAAAYINGFHNLPYMFNAQHGRHLATEHATMADGKAESKPRLSKEEVEKLEKVFQENPKPSSSIKAALAEELRLDRPRINNWFQNRRAKAKTTRKLEEYEASRAAEKEAAGSASPDEATVRTSEAAEENASTCTSSAPFPGLTADQPVKDEAWQEDHNQAGGQYDDGDASRLSDEMASPFPPHLTQAHQRDVATGMQSPVSLNFASSDQMSFDYPQVSHDYHPQLGAVDHASMEATSSLLNSAAQPGQSRDSSSPTNSFTYSESFNPNIEYTPAQYFDMTNGGHGNPQLPFFEQPCTSDEQASADSPATSGTAPQESPLCRPRPVLSNLTIPENLGDSTNSFKAPPPPANIASRRNMAKPAALQAASLRSRTMNMQGGPKTSLEGSRRTDPSSPVSSMRRIASSTGNMGGRIQKQSGGPRSPMILSRNTENYLHFHSRSPVANLASPFPPTPLTPAVYGQQDIHDPKISSNCSDDEAFMLGDGSTGFGLPNSLKTPPGTPGMLSFIPQNFSNHPLSAGLDFADQPLLTPQFQTEFPDLSQHHVPSYLETGDNSLPSTPLYANMMNVGHDSLSMLGGGPGNTQYDWDTNESINSSTASPSQIRSKQILFTQNMTPQDYTLHEV